MEKDKRRALIPVTSVAFAPCPDCKKMINLAATACPKCGLPIKKGDHTPVQPKPINLGCIFLGAILVILIIAMAIKVSNEKEQDQRIRERILDTERQRSGG